MNIAISITLLLLGDFSFADCLSLPGRDGAMAATVCTPNATNSTPLSSWGNPPAWYGRSINSPNPIFRAPSPPAIAPNPFPSTSQSVPAFRPPSYSPPAMPEIPPPKMPELPNVQIPPAPNFGVEAQDAVAMLSIFRKIALEQALRAAEQNRRASEEWLRATTDVTEKARGELGQYIDQSEDAIETAQSPAVDASGLISVDGLITSKAKGLRNGLIIQSSDDGLGREIRNLINRALKAGDDGASLSEAEQSHMAIAAAQAADQAITDGKPYLAKSLLRVAATTIDLTFSLIPVVSSANDASQAMLGMLTGYDLAGNRMESGDYILRGVGVVLGLMPTGGILRFGSFAVDRTTLFLANAYRKMGFSEYVQFVLPALRVLRNELGAIGSGIGRIAKYQAAFADDSQKLKQMLSVMEEYNSMISVGHRKLMGHPGAAGFESAIALQAAYRTNAARDLLAEEVAFKILKEGVRTQKIMLKRKVLVYEYRLATGYGAYFDATTDKFITFIGPQK